MWRRLDPACLPSHRAVCATSVQLLPLIEMYCKWELQEDCSNLWELMLRFDSEADLATHDLGRSLLLMLHDDDAGMRIVPPRVQMSALVSPFAVIRTRLAAMGEAFQTLQPQVHQALEVQFLCSITKRLWCLWALHYSCHHTGLCPSGFIVKFYSPMFCSPLVSVSIVPLPLLACAFGISVLLISPAIRLSLFSHRQPACLLPCLSASHIQSGAGQCFPLILACRRILHLPFHSGAICHLPL